MVSSRDATRRTATTLGASIPTRDLTAVPSLGPPERERPPAPPCVEHRHGVQVPSSGAMLRSSVEVQSGRSAQGAVRASARAASVGAQLSAASDAAPDPVRPPGRRLARGPLVPGKAGATSQTDGGALGASVRSQDSDVECSAVSTTPPRLVGGSGQKAQRRNTSKSNAARAARASVCAQSVAISHRSEASPPASGRAHLASPQLDTSPIDPCGGIDRPGIRCTQASPGLRSVAPIPSRLEPPRAPSELFAVQTSYAGSLELVNLALAMGWYANFSGGPSKFETGSLPIWDFLRLVTLRLVGPRFRDDPLSPLYASLSSEQCHLHGTDAARAAAVQHRRSRSGKNAPSGPKGWLEDTVRSVRRQLKASLCSPTHAHACQLLLAQRGQIVLSPGRLDVHLSLERLPIEIRLAGLDRNPGFIPAANRIVEFHYA
jgi:hypothetical protein